MNHSNNASVCACPPGRIFVFGSNRRGVHGAGSALHAAKFHGAIYLQGEGLQGQSYAIPTKSTPYIPLLLPHVKLGVDRFIRFANDHPELTFEVTKIGCGLAGFQESLIRPLFKSAPKNCMLPEGWR